MPSARPPKKARVSKLLVVDASVMMAAGGEEAGPPSRSNVSSNWLVMTFGDWRICGEGVAGWPAPVGVPASPLGVLLPAGMQAAIASDRAAVTRRKPPPPDWKAHR